MVDVIGAYLVGKIGVVGRPQARRRSRRHGLRPCVSTQSKRPAAEMLRFAGICGERWFAVAFGGMDMK